MLRNTVIFALLPVLISGQCGIGAVYDGVSRRCYRNYDAAVSYQAAQLVCSQADGKLSSKAVTSDSTWIASGDGKCLRSENSQVLAADCDQKLSFSCEYESSNLDATCAPQATERCPSSFAWFEKTNSCYKATIDNVDYSSANKSCESEGAHLASIHSVEENDFIAGLTATGLNYTDSARVQNIFIGLVYLDNVWKWTDGSAVDYLNWATGEPNKMTSELWTTLMPDPDGTYNPTGGMWNNAASSQQRGFVCKKASS